MKTQKDRLRRVIVIGATPSGVAATNKLEELGIPVTLIDSDFDLDQKLAIEEWKLKSGIPLNHALRPGLIRILRNPAIRVFLPAEVISIKHSAQGFRGRIKRSQTFIDPDKCTLCGRCVELCPVSLPGGEKAVKLNSRRSIPGRAVIDKRMQPLCQANCPLGVNAQGYINLARTGKFAEALALIRENNILPGICGRICTHPCEDACRRSELDEPLAIRDIKRFLADYELSHSRDINNNIDPKISNIGKKPEKIAIIGSGPSGLAAAAELAKSGYNVTLFEKENQAGGLLRYGIGSHRLPRKILDIELKYIENLGVDFVTSSNIDLKIDIDRLSKEFNAVILATGVWADRMLGVPGEDLEGVEGCLSFLRKFHYGEINGLPKKIAVIGDGNAAFDLARTVARTGSDVTILSWFSHASIPADKEEIKAAKEERISIINQAKTVEFIGTGGKLELIRCKPTRPGEPDTTGICWPEIIPGSKPFELEFDMALVAIGQKSPFAVGAGPSVRPKCDINKHGYILTDQSMRTSFKGVYAAGDAVSGPSSVVDAMAAGRKTARSVHLDLSQASGLNIEPENRPLRPANRDFSQIPQDLPSLARSTMPERQPAIRIKNFDEVALGLKEPQVIIEAERCLQCGVCSECMQCVEVCNVGAINHSAASEEININGGVAIIADPSMATNIKGEDVIRAYGPTAAKPDVNAMLMRGYAAAARAMHLLGGTSQRLKGHGISFSPPEPELSSDIRIGIFACRCNDSFGWLDSMSKYLTDLQSRKDVVHTEVMPAACLEEGYTGIIKRVREKGITRIVLASCVCCPLNFICSSCTDQRSRLKNALFQGTGISRSMVETCNLRGEVLRLIRANAFNALNSFMWLIDRSLKMARMLKPLPVLARNYNFTTGVIGNSEAAICSALTLARSGFDVFLFGSPEQPFYEKPDHPNIYGFENSSVKGFTGTLGDFQIFIESGETKQTLQVGTVIIGEKSIKRIPYLHQAGLPSRMVAYSMQKAGKLDRPFLYPGTTSISGLFLANSPGISASNLIKGAAAAAHAAAIMPSRPRQSRGFTVLVDENLCRGCGRCIASCPYHAVTLHENSIGGWSAKVDQAICKGCGNCISVCPTNAADSPYRNQAFLEHTLEEILIQGGATFHS
ncbi:MAG: FAD-dependent oxidoreductase [Deltaproteobacteria bacterium]|nr:FAD-dependent oxidoreductase [Deltaproteobacteria bacterium]